MVQNRKAKNEIDNQNRSHFDSIIDLNQRISTPLATCADKSVLCMEIANKWLTFHLSAEGWNPLLDYIAIKWLAFHLSAEGWNPLLDYIANKWLSFHLSTEGWNPLLDYIANTVSISFECWSLEPTSRLSS